MHSLANIKPSLQPKLKIGSPNDKFEQEADQVADQVMRMPQDHALQMQPQEEEEEMMQPKLKVSSLQRQPLEEEEELMQPKLKTSENTFNLQRQSEDDEEEEILQPKSKSNSASFADKSVQSQINSTKGNGANLDRSTNTAMSQSIGADFSRVNIHTGSTAIQLNQQLNASAFTVGNDIYFNSGNYDPASSSGKRLLAHELTHVVQQGAVQRQMIQKNGPLSMRKPPKLNPTKQGATSTSPTKNPLAKQVAALLKEQSSDKNLKKHFKSLGEALQKLALSSSSASKQGPERLAALNITGAFQTASTALINDKGFQNLKKRIIGIIGSSDTVTLTAVLAAAIAVVLADIPVKAKKINQKLGKGFSVGGGFDFGTIQSLQFNSLNAYAMYAHKYFMTKIGGAVKRDAKTGQFSGSGTGSLRLGNKSNGLTGSLTVNQAGEVTVAALLKNTYGFGGKKKLIFTYNLEHKIATGETIFKPGVSGKFPIGHLESLKIGTALSFKKGKTGVTGYLEYQRRGVRLRLEGSLEGIKDERSLAPGRNMKFQVVLSIPLGKP